jgi:hypothetical protein
MRCNFSQSLKFLLIFLELILSYFFTENNIVTAFDKTKNQGENALKQLSGRLRNIRSR